MKVAVVARAEPAVEPARRDRCTALPVRSLAAPMKLAAYVTTGKPKLDALVVDLRAILERYRTASELRFEYTIVDTTHDERAQSRARKAGLTPFALLTGDEEVPDKLSGHMGIAIDYGAEHATKTLTPQHANGLEFAVATKIREVRLLGEGKKHRIGVLTGHDELLLSEPNLVPSTQTQKPNMRGILAQYFPFYELIDVELNEGRNAAIDPSLEGLIITQPAKDLTDQELARIDDFVVHGRSLAVVASAVNVAAGDPTMSATLSTHRLENLLGEYGFELRRDVVEEFGHPFHINVISGASAQPLTLRFPAILDVKDDERFTGREALLDAESPIFFRLPQVLFPYASSLILHPEKQPDARDGFRVHARSTPKALRETTANVDLKVVRQWRPVGEFAQYNVAASVQGPLRNAFPGPSTRVPTASPRSSRVLVIASSQFFANPFARAAGGDEMLDQLAMPYAQQILTHTILVARNMVEWMTLDDDLVACARIPNGAR